MGVTGHWPLTRCLSVTIRHVMVDITGFIPNVHAVNGYAGVNAEKVVSSVMS